MESKEVKYLSKEEVSALVDQRGGVFQWVPEHYEKYRPKYIGDTETEIIVEK